MTTWLTVETITAHMKDPMLLDELTRTTKEVYDIFRQQPGPIHVKDGFMLREVHSYKAQGAVRTKFTKTMGAHYHSFVLVPYTAKQCLMCED